MWVTCFLVLGALTSEIENEPLGLHHNCRKSNSIICSLFQEMPYHCVIFLSQKVSVVSFLYVVFLVKSEYIWRVAFSLSMLPENELLLNTTQKMVVKNVRVCMFVLSVYICVPKSLP